MDGSRRESQFANLKTKFRNLIFPSTSPLEQTHSLEKIKDFFKESINSNRAMSKVGSLQDIFQLLEDRGLLSESNLSPLWCLGNFLKIPNINEVVEFYVEFHWKNNNEYCKCICGTNCNFEEYLNQPNQDNNSSDLNNNDGKDELGEALTNIAIRIGKLWPVLIRRLDVKEKHIDEIRQKFPLENQPKEAFMFWRRSAGTHATLKTLDAALQDRLCKKEGLGLHLKSAVYSV